MLISIIAMLDLHIYQIDDKTNILSEDLNEEIYMILPYRFIEHGQENKVYKLTKCLYSLK